MSLRRAIQYALLLFFVILLDFARYPYYPRVPVQLFLWLDPLVGISAMISGRLLIVSLLLGLVVLASAVLLGRLFCGFFCPLGTTIDISEKILYRKQKPRLTPEHRRFRPFGYLFLALALVAAAARLPLFYLLDPIPLATRIYSYAIYPVYVLVLNLGLDLLRPLARPLGWSDLEYTSYIQPRFGANLAALAIFAGILFLSAFQRRFWCRNLCPLGALLGLCSRFNFWRKTVSDACTDCAKCYRECPAGAIRDQTWTDREEDCIKCLVCRDVCPEGAIAYPLRSPGKGQPLEVDLRRREVLIAGASGAALALAAKTSFSGNARDDQILRPPGALPEPLYLATCVRCGECVKSCVTNTLQPDGWTRGLSGLWVPRHQMRLAGCEQFCNVCGQVCPTGAIRPLDLEEKRYAKLGTAVILKEKCIAWEQDKLCLVCDECCPYNAIVFKTLEGRPRPVVMEDRCNGCGWCEHKCPVDGAAAIVVKPLGQIRLAKGSYQDEARRFGLYLREAPDEFIPSEPSPNNSDLPRGILPSEP
jgi:ferredoxin-type protein NapF